MLGSIRYLFPSLNLVVVLMDIFIAHEFNKTKTLTENILKIMKLFCSMYIF